MFLLSQAAGWVSHKHNLTQPPNNPLRQALMVPLYKEGNWDSGNLSNLPNKTQVPQPECKPRRSDLVRLVQVSPTREGAWPLLATKNGTSHAEGGLKYLLIPEGWVNDCTSCWRCITLSPKVTATPCRLFPVPRQVQALGTIEIVGWDGEEVISSGSLSL